MWEQPDSARVLLNLSGADRVIQATIHHASGHFGNSGIPLPAPRKSISPLISFGSESSDLPSRTQPLGTIKSATRPHRSHRSRP